MTPEKRLDHLTDEMLKIFQDLTKEYNQSEMPEGIADIKVNLIMALAKNGYPPVDRGEVYKEIFEQAENFKKYNG